MNKLVLMYDGAWIAMVRFDDVVRLYLWAVPMGKVRQLTDYKFVCDMY